MGAPKRSRLALNLLWQAAVPLARGAAPWAPWPLAPGSVGAPLGGRRPVARAAALMSAAPPGARGARSGAREATEAWEWRPVISWYPGHIARAEKQLLDMLKMVDVVIELRDSRIPTATHHPLITQWVGSRGHVLVMNRMDAVPTSVVQDWSRHFEAEGVEAHWVNARDGKGVDAAKRAILRAGAHVNAKRKRKGLLPRAVRACVLGFPNVGKSALINRLVGRAKLKSENRAGVTRSFAWAAVGGAKARRVGRASAGGGTSQLELLDTPGIIPARQVSQRAAYMLAVCDDIGAAAYDSYAVALTLLAELRAAAPGYVPAGVLEARYGFGLGEERAAPAAAAAEGAGAGAEAEACGSPEAFLARVATERCAGDLERATVQLLQDFRSGRLGTIGLESPRGYSGAAAAPDDQGARELSAARRRGG